jgi:hypothetical protein
VTSIGATPKSGSSANGENCFLTAHFFHQQRHLTMSPSPTTLSNPRDGERVPLGTLIYFRVRNQQHFWEMIIGEFEKSGITQAELCRRTGRDPKRVCDFLGSPGNHTLNTISDYLFAMSGAQPECDISHPLAQMSRIDSAGAKEGTLRLKDDSRKATFVLT